MKTVRLLTYMVLLKHIARSLIKMHGIIMMLQVVSVIIKELMFRTSFK